VVSGPKDKGLSVQINVTRDCSVHPPWIQSTSAERFYFFFIFSLGKILSRSKKSWYYCPRTSKSQFRDFHARIKVWSLIIYCIITGLGFNWACAFLWFSRRYAFFSTPVIAVTGLIMAFYAGIALLVARFTGGNWRTALLVFVFVPVVLAGIVLRSGLLR